MIHLAMNTQRMQLLVPGVLSYSLLWYTLFKAICFAGAGIIPGEDNITAGARWPMGMQTGVLVFTLVTQPISLLKFKQGFFPAVHPVLHRSLLVALICVPSLLLMQYWQGASNYVWQIEDPSAMVPLTFVYFTGWSVVLLSSFLAGHGQLTGIGPVWRHAFQKPAGSFSPRLPVSHHLVCEPFLLGLLLLTWATPQMTWFRLMLGLLILLLSIRLFRGKRPH